MNQNAVLACLRDSRKGNECVVLILTVMSLVFFIAKEGSFFYGL